MTRTTPNPSPTIRVSADYASTSRAAAEHITQRAEAAVAARDVFTLVLAGGSTPKRLYELLAADPLRERMPWDQTHLFWGDERFVPPEHEASNYRMAQETLIDHVPLPPDHIHPVPTNLDSPSEAAAAYEAALQAFFNTHADTTAFDCVLLGLGTDGHTASLFPEDAPHASPDTNSWVRAVTAPPRHTPRQRVTLTLPALNQAREALFLVSGAQKRDAVQAVLEQTDLSLPAAHVAPRETLTWFVDEAAYGARDA